jgi:hypothetical protein
MILDSIVSSGQGTIEDYFPFKEIKINFIKDFLFPVNFMYMSVHSFGPDEIHAIGKPLGLTERF